LTFPSDFKALNEHDTLFHELPLRSSQKGIDIYFTGEVPAKPYYRITVLQSSFPLYTYQGLLSELKEKALKKGMDAIMILDMKPQEGNKDYVNTNMLYAVGLKYRETMKYVDTIVRNVHIESLNDKAKPMDISLDMMGQILNESIDRSVEYYEKNISLFNKADWLAQQKGIDRYDPNMYYKAKAITLWGDIKYIVTKPHESVHIIWPDVDKNLVLSYTFRTDGLLETRIISEFRKHNPLFRDVYSYDEQKRCNGFIRYALPDNTPISKLTYEFYSLNELPVTDNQLMMSHN
jgi:hypothetical protein